MRIWNLYFIMQANLLIHILYKLPLIKEIMPVHLKKLDFIKKIFGFIAVIFDVLLKLVTTNIALYITIWWIPTKLFELFDSKYSTPYALIIFLVITCILPALTQSQMFKLGRDDHMFLEYLRMSPSTYYKYKLVRLLIKNVLFTLPTLTFVFKDIQMVIALFVIKLMITLLGHAFYTKLYDMNKSFPKIFVRSIFSAVITVTCVIALINIPASILTININYLLIVSVISIPVSLISFKFLYNYKKYLSIARKFVNSESTSLQVTMINVAETDTALEETSVEENKLFLKKHKEKKGMDYLNKAYLDRHNTQIKRFYRQRVIAIFVISLVLAFLVKKQSWTVDMSMIMSKSSWLLVLMSLVSFAKSYTELYYYHCDRFFINNKMFSKKETVFNGFKFRLSFLVKQSLKICLAFGIAICGFLYLSQVSVNVTEITSMYLAISCLFLFTELMQLIIYYLVQPYTDNPNIKKPSYRVMSWVQNVSLLLLVLLKSDLSSAVLLIAALTSSATIVGIILVKTFSHKTFAKS